jgi:hypothetical protein
LLFDALLLRLFPALPYPCIFQKNYHIFDGQWQAAKIQGLISAGRGGLLKLIGSFQRLVMVAESEAQ